MSILDLKMLNTEIIAYHKDKSGSDFLTFPLDITIKSEVYQVIIFAPCDMQP